jgi:hypothetical protein
VSLVICSSWKSAFAVLSSKHVPGDMNLPSATKRLLVLPSRRCFRDGLLEHARSPSVALVNHSANRAL